MKSLFKPVKNVVRNTHYGNINSNYFINRIKCVKSTVLNEATKTEKGHHSYL